VLHTTSGGGSDSIVEVKSTVTTSVSEPEPSQSQLELVNPPPPKAETVPVPEPAQESSSTQEPSPAQPDIEIIVNRVKEDTVSSGVIDALESEIIQAPESKPEPSKHIDEPEEKPSPIPVPTTSESKILEHKIEITSRNTENNTVSEIPEVPLATVTDSVESTQSIATSEYRGTEIRQENIKQALNEIISEIDRAVVEAESDLDKGSHQPPPPPSNTPYHATPTPTPKMRSLSPGPLLNAPSQYTPAFMLPSQSSPSAPRSYTPTFKLSSGNPPGSPGFTAFQPSTPRQIGNPSPSGFTPFSSNYPAARTPDPMPAFNVPQTGEESDGSGIYYRSDHVCSRTTQYNTAPTTPIPFLEIDYGNAPAYTEPLAQVSH